MESGLQSTVAEFRIDSFLIHEAQSQIPTQLNSEFQELTRLCTSYSIVLGVLYIVSSLVSIRDCCQSTDLNPQPLCLARIKEIALPTGATFANMGCAESTPVVDLRTVNGGWKKGQQGAPFSSIHSEYQEYAIKEKLFSWSGDDYKVHDGKGRILCYVKGKILSMRDRAVILDANKQPIAILQRKLLQLVETYRIDSFEPNFPGQSSDLDYEGRSLYTFATITREFASVPPKFTVNKAVGAKQTNVLCFVKLQIAFKLTMQVVKSKADVSPLAYVDQTSVFQLQDANTFVLRAAAGTDHLLMVLLAIAVDQMREDN